MNSPITIKEIEFIILKFPEKKSLSPKNKSSYVSFSGKHGRIFPHLFYEVILPIPKPKEVQKREVQTDSSNQYEAKVVNKISANRIQQHEIIYMYIKYIHHDRMEFISGLQGWFSIQKRISMFHRFNRVKKENHVIAINAENTLDKIQHPHVLKLAKNKKRN